MTEQATLVLMAGPPGAGKSTVAQAVGLALGWPVVDKDTIKSALLTVGVAEDLAGRASYELLYDLGRDLLARQRMSVILDSPAAYPIVVEKTTALAQEADAVLRVVLCLADRAVRERRLVERVTRPSQWTADVGLVGDSFAEWGGHLPPGTFTVHTNRPVTDLLPEVLAYVHGKSLPRPSGAIGTCALCDPNLAPVVTEGQHWRLVVNRNQNLLGKCFLAARCHTEAVSALTADEWRDLRRELTRTTRALVLAFAPDHFNYVFLQNQDRHVHLHVIPRYAGTREFAGGAFADPDYPDHYAVPAPVRALSPEQMAALAGELRHRLSDPMIAGDEPPHPSVAR